MYSKALNIRTVIYRKGLFQWSAVETYATAPWKARDPFGLKGEENLELTIQGIYINPPKKKVEAAVDSTDIASSEGEGTGVVNEDKVYLKNKFGPLSQTRAEKTLASDVTAEAIYASSFGQIRFDKDNLVTYDGQFDEDFHDPGVEERSKFQQSSDEFKSNENIANSRNASNYVKVTTPIGSHEDNANHKKMSEVSNTDLGKLEKEIKGNGKETIIESELKPFYEGGPRIVTPASPNPKTAAEFIKILRMKEKQEKEANLELKVGGRPLNIPKSSVTIEPKEHVPKVYTQFDWQETTHDDVWVYLRKNICFQNEFLVAINKPLGLPMHTPTASCRHTVIDFLKEFADHCRVREIFPCHRLDKDTTGVLLLATSEKAAAAIKAKFANRTIIKQYFAIVKNCPPMREGTIKIPIGEGKVPNTDVFRAVLKPDLEKFSIQSMQKNCVEATTWFKVLKSKPYAAFVEARPETGLTHQIRVHLAHGLSCPILGDHKYSHRDKMAPQRLHTEMLNRLNVKQSKVRQLPLHLHCSKLQFTMPDGFMSKNVHEPTFIHAKLPYFFMHSLKVLGMK